MCIPLTVSEAVAQRSLCKGRHCFKRPWKVRIREGQKLMLLRPGPASVFCISTKNIWFQHVVCSRFGGTAEAQRRLECLRCASAVPPQCLAGMGWKLSLFPPHPNPKITIRPLVDGAVIEEQLPGTEFLPPAHFLPWAAARGGIFGPSPCHCSMSLMCNEWPVWPRLVPSCP